MYPSHLSKALNCEHCVVTKLKLYLRIIRLIKFYLIGVGILTQLYKSSSSFLARFCALVVGHLIWGPEEDADLVTKLGSNFRRNCSNFYRSIWVTERRAPLNASSKCLRVISGTGSKFWAFPPFSIKALILASASIAWITRKLHLEQQPLRLSGKFQLCQHQKIHQ